MINVPFVELPTVYTLGKRVKSDHLTRKKENVSTTGFEVGKKWKWRFRGWGREFKICKGNRAYQLE